MELADALLYTSNLEEYIYFFFEGVGGKQWLPLEVSSNDIQIYLFFFVVILGCQPWILPHLVALCSCSSLNGLEMTSVTLSSLKQVNNKFILSFRRTSHETTALLLLQNGQSNSKELRRKVKTALLK